MRRFRVGDRVRFETDKTGDWPRWDYSVDCGGDGEFLSGTVTDEDDLCLTVEWDKKCWDWPQPGEPDSEYGAPGYLELVEAVEDQGSNPKWVEADVDSHQRGYDAGYENGLRDGKIMVLREQERQHNEVELSPAIDLEKQQEVIRKLGIKKADVDASLAPTKTVTVDEAAEMVESILMVRAYNHVGFVAKERARAIAWALVGKTVVKK